MIDLVELGLEVPKNIKWELLTLDQIKSQEKRSIISGPFGSNISSKFFTSTGVPVIRGNNLSNQIGIKFKDTGFVFISPEKANELNSWAIKDDLIFTAAGTIGQVGIITGNEKYENYTISNKQLRVRLDKSIINPYYAYYWFASPAIVDIIIQRDTGSTIPLINLGVLKSLPILLPPLPEQESIAEVLSGLDDKIDLLKRNNKTLEQLAETLFRQWFVEEADDSWDKVSLKSLCVKITKGTTPTTLGKSFVDTGINFIKAESLNESGGFIPNKLSYIDESTNNLLLRSQINKGDILFTIAGTIGRTSIVSEDILPANTNQAVAIIRVNPNIISEVFMKYVMKSDFIKEIMESKIVHAVQPNLSLGEISDTEINLPPKPKLNRFDSIVYPIQNKINNNNKQIQQLESLRDTLLPKLMSGVVIVKN